MSSDSIVYQCWHCNRSGGRKSGRTEWRGQRAALYAIADNPVQETKFKVSARAIHRPLDADHAEWLAERKISLKTAQTFGVQSCNRWFTKLQKEAPGISFPYYEPGKLHPYAHKIRAVAEKAFTQDGSAQSFFGVHLAQPEKPILIVEGELDCLSAHQALNPGISQNYACLSVPNGAPMLVRDGKIEPSEDRKFQYVYAAKDLLARSSRIFIGTDADEPGNALAEELARKIGRERCWRVRWPDACKDANDVLVAFGPEGIQECLAEAEPWPVNGLHRASEFLPPYLNLFRNGMPRGLSTGWRNVDDLVTIQQGLVYVVTGIPSSGKSAWLNNLLVNVAKRYDWHVCFASFEQMPIEMHIARLASIYVGKPFRMGPTERMSEAEAIQAHMWVNERFSFLSQHSVAPTVPSLLERFRASVMRNGTRAVVMDPFTHIEFEDTDSMGPSTANINSMLGDVKLFAEATDCAVFVVAHPSKPGIINGQKFIPNGYSISGSAHWYNRADFGITIHRPEDLPPEVHVWKSRWDHLGKQGHTSLLYDVPTGIYSEPQT